ncbi:hypothetical protein FGB62_70g16 [Gracilaria domingensis]|nr:hypothetical protein FGB62_70g16 [Gracilaria domingensis]
MATPRRSAAAARRVRRAWRRPSPRALARRADAAVRARAPRGAGTGVAATAFEAVAGDATPLLAGTAGAPLDALAAHPVALVSHVGRRGICAPDRPHAAGGRGLAAVAGKGGRCAQRAGRRVGRRFSGRYGRGSLQSAAVGG